jgi:PncC family amidohydrolase
VIDNKAPSFDEAKKLVQILAEKKLLLAAAESCTAGLVADAIAQVSGASKVFWGSFVSYRAEAKSAMLGIGEALLEECGLVSSETACAMALGALEKSGADCAVSVTGLAGPEGAGSAVEVGTVWIGTALKRGETGTKKFIFKKSRNELREAAARQAIHEIASLIEEFY